MSGSRTGLLSARAVRLGHTHKTMDERAIRAGTKTARPLGARASLEGGGIKSCGIPAQQPHLRSVAEFFSATKHSGIQVCEAVNSIRRIASNSPVLAADRERISAGAQKYCGHSANFRWAT